MLSVLPILYLEDFLMAIGIWSLNIFWILHSLSSLYSYSLLFLYLVVFICLLGFFWGIWKIQHINNMMRISGIFILLLVLFLGIIGGVQLFFSIFPGIDIFLWNGIYFQNYIFNSLQLIILYYLLIAFLEESSKYFSFSGIIDRVQSQDNNIIGIIFIALGFAFLENILYLYSFYNIHGVSWDLVKLWVFRGVFSTMLHVLCSVLIYRAFRSLYLGFFHKLSTTVGFFLVAITGIILHSMYDVFLSVWMVFMVFVYLVGGYLYVGSVIYHQNISRGVLGEEIG